MMTTRGTVKIKTTEGEHKQAILGDGADGEEYIKHLMPSTASWRRRTIRLI
jgi:hypothetical protein